MGTMIGHDKGSATLGLQKQKLQKWQLALAGIVVFFFYGSRFNVAARFVPDTKKWEKLDVRPINKL